MIHFPGHPGIIFERIPLYALKYLLLERYHSRPIIVEKAQNITVALGSSTNFTCKFLSDLNPNIFWVQGKGLDGKIVKVHVNVVNSQNKSLFA